MKNLIVVAPQPIPFAGSEPGKGFFWAVALSKFYQVHLVCLDFAVPALKNCDLCKSFVYHPVAMPPPMLPGLPFYQWYRSWCDAVIPHIRKISPLIHPIGIHHITIGSFRVLPAYDRLGIPYTLGPLGGGEYVPLKFLLSTKFPLEQKIGEILRPVFNCACVRNPFIRPILKQAQATIATTGQTAQLLCAAGSRNVSTVFPDVTSDQLDNEFVFKYRQAQSKVMQKRFELIFSGRALWWKGCDLALLVLEKLLERGVSVRLTVVTGGGNAVGGWKKLGASERVAPYVRWLDLMPKPELLQLYLQSHAFLYPTLHDSSSSSIPEAYSTGLPSVTLGIGGAGMASTKETGFNEFHETADRWAAQACEHILKWTLNSDTWLNASTSARSHADGFAISGIEKFISNFYNFEE